MNYTLSQEFVTITFDIMEVHKSCQSRSNTEERKKDNAKQNLMIQTRLYYFKNIFLITDSKQEQEETGNELKSFQHLPEDN